MDRVTRSLTPGSSQFRARRSKRGQWSGETEFEAARSAGFTTVVSVPRAGIWNGQSAVINLAGNSVSEMVIKPVFAEHVSYSTIGGGQFPASLMGTFAALRQMLLDAQRL